MVSIVYVLGNCLIHSVRRASLRVSSKHHESQEEAHRESHAGGPFRGPQAHT